MNDIIKEYIKPAIDYIIENPSKGSLMIGIFVVPTGLYINYKINNLAPKYLIKFPTTEKYDVKFKKYQQYKNDKIKPKTSGKLLG